MYYGAFSSCIYEKILVSLQLSENFGGEKLNTIQLCNDKILLISHLIYTHYITNVSTILLAINNSLYTYVYIIYDY